MSAPLPLPRGARFDIAREGHTHLLPANRKHSKAPGDDKAMAAARSAFLGKGLLRPAAGRNLRAGCVAHR